MPEVADNKLDFGSFVYWWFEKRQEKPRTGVVKSKNTSKLLSTKEVKAVRQKARLKAQQKSDDFKAFRMNSPCRKVPSKGKFKAEIFTKDFTKENKLVYDVHCYNPHFVPAGNERQLEHVDKIWKNYDTKGTGRVSPEQFSNFVKDLGFTVKEQRIVQSMQDPASKSIVWEKFITWWFSKERSGIIPVAPPAPEAKVQKTKVIKEEVKAINEKYKAKFALQSDDQWLKNKRKAQSAALEKRAAFKKFRMTNSPKKTVNVVPVSIAMKVKGKIEVKNYRLYER